MVELTDEIRYRVIDQQELSLHAEKYGLELQRRIQTKFYSMETEPDLKEGIKKQVDNLVKGLVKIEVALDVLKSIRAELPPEEPKE